MVLELGEEDSEVHWGMHVCMYACRRLSLVSLSVVVTCTSLNYPTSIRRRY